MVDLVLVRVLGEEAAHRWPADFAGQPGTNRRPVARSRTLALRSQPRRAATGAVADPAQQCQPHQSGLDASAVHRRQSVRNSAMPPPPARSGSARLRSHWRQGWPRCPPPASGDPPPSQWNAHERCLTRSNGRLRRCCHMRPPDHRQASDLFVGDTAACQATVRHRCRPMTPAGNTHAVSLHRRRRRALS